MRVKRCFSFSDLNSTVELVDDRGCPQPTIMSPFTYKRASGTAEARLFSMFRFPDSNRVHFQCDIVICKGACSMPDCSQTDFEQVPAPQARSLEEPKADALTQPPDDGALMASYSVFVVEPGTLPEVESCENCGPVPVWLLYLCIVFGILFLVMLIINLFLCTAMSCSCTKESKLDKETSYLEDFDPYSRSWHGSQYGSRYGLNANLSTRPDGSSRPATPLQHNGSTSLDLRYSLNGGIKTVPVPYLPADTTRSVSSTSEYGGAINSRPNSRHSSHRPRGPSSTSGFSSGNSRQSSRGLVAK